MRWTHCTRKSSLRVGDHKTKKHQPRSLTSMMKDVPFRQPFASNDWRGAITTTVHVDGTISRHLLNGVQRTSKYAIRSRFAAILRCLPSGGRRTHGGLLLLQQPRGTVRRKTAFIDIAVRPEGRRDDNIVICITENIVVARQRGVQTSLRQTRFDASSTRGDEVWK